MDEKKSKELIKRYLGGEEESLRLLFSMYLDPIYFFIKKMISNEEDSKDITQETFIKIWKNLYKYDERKKFSTWVFQIARNSAIDHLRKKKCLSFSDIQTDGEDAVEDRIGIDEIDPEKIIIKEEDVSGLKNAILNLPIKYREIVLLKLENDMSLEEISIVLNKPINTIKSTYRRSLLKLKKIIAPK